MQAIGVFDSGLGGLTTVKELGRLLPREDVIYFGDTARIPYGSKSRETVMRYARQDIDFLKSKNVKMIIAACGTVSSLIEANPFETDIPFTGVLMPAVSAACKATKNNKIGVIGTLSTIKSGSYARIINSVNPKAEVFQNSCPMFVPLVENGYTDGEITDYFVREYLEKIKNCEVDTLILGCTHYPILCNAISKYMGENVKLISPGQEAAKFANETLINMNLQNTDNEKGINTYYVSDDPEDFRQNASAFLGEDIKGKVYHTDI